MAKSKTQQYISRREAGQSPEEAQKRSYLKRSGAWKAEQKYLEAQKAAAEALEAAQAAEIASQEAQKAERLRQKDEAARSRRVAETPKTKPKGWREVRCRYCQSDYPCSCPDPRDQEKQPPVLRPEVASYHPISQAGLETSGRSDLPQPEMPITEMERLLADHHRRMGVSHMGLPESWIEGMRRQAESGMDAPDPLTLADLDGATWTKEAGLVTEGMRREAEFREEQDRLRDWEDSSDPWKARMRKMGVL
jgi:hypothetical protein